METEILDRPANILVVDDDDEVRGMLAETLVDFGYGVSQAASGEEALPLVMGDLPIDMLITDIRMPGMSGLELAELVRRGRAEVRIILISGYFEPQSVAERFLRKPFHMQELASAIRDELCRPEDSTPN